MENNGVQYFCPAALDFNILEVDETPTLIQPPVKCFQNRLLTREQVVSTYLEDLNIETDVQSTAVESIASQKSKLLVLNSKKGGKNGNLKTFTNDEKSRKPTTSEFLVLSALSKANYSQSNQLGLTNLCYYNACEGDKIIDETMARSAEEYSDIKSSNQIKFFLLKVWIFVGVISFLFFVPFILQNDRFGLKRFLGKQQNTLPLVSEVLPDRVLGVHPIYNEVSPNSPVADAQENVALTQKSNNLEKTNQPNSNILFTQLLAFLVLKYILEILWKSSWHLSEYFFFKVQHYFSEKGLK